MNTKKLCKLRWTPTSLRNVVDAIGVEEICRASSRKLVVTEELGKIRCPSEAVENVLNNQEWGNVVDAQRRQMLWNKRGGRRQEEEHPGC